MAAAAMKSAPIPKASTKPVAYKLPKTLAACADELYTTRQARLTLQKEVEELAKKEALLRDHIIDNLPKSQATGIAGKVARATIELKDIVQVEDWDKFHAYIAKEAPKNPGIWAMLQKRTGDTAIKEVLMFNAKAKIPGVKMGQVPTVSLNKV